VTAARAEFRALGLEHWAERLIFLDESGVNLSMTRSCARAVRGQRAPGHVPKNWGDSVTLCAGIALRGLVAPLYLHGSMNGETFEAYVEQFLVPELRPGDIAVMSKRSCDARRPAPTMPCSTPSSAPLVPSPAMTLAVGSACAATVHPSEKCFRGRPR
jgi:hypothetical protein